MTVAGDAAAPGAAVGELRRSALGMGLWTAASRLAGLGRVLVIAAVLGTTYLGNAFQAANSVSNVLFELLAAGALSAVLVPTFVRLLDAGDSAEAERRAGGLLGLALVVLGAVAVVGVALAPWIADLLASGVDDPVVRAEQADLMAFLLVFFVPQVLLYAWGAVATAVLHARRRFAVTAAAPIANTVVMVALLLVFRALAGGERTLDLGTAERFTLAAAGTLGVAGFVGVLAVAAERAGVRIRPRAPWKGGPELRRLLGHSVWGVALHAAGGLLLGAAIVLGGRVEGGVVAYQVAFVIFLAPYAVLAQPVHTAVLPELAGEGAVGDRDRFGDRLRWATESIAALLVPVSAALVVFARPAMEVVAFGAARDGGALLGAGVAALGAGLAPYSVFLLLARASYATGDSRTPAVVAIACGLAGALVMAAAAPQVEGAAVVAALGIGHSTAYLLGAVVLGVVLWRRTGVSALPRALAPACGLTLAVAGGAWGALRWAGWSGRSGAAAVTVVIGGIAAVAYAAGWRLLRPAWETAR
jgi:putative peptidoglycan lipid II flippase